VHACNTLAFSTRYSTRSSYPQLFGVNESMATGTTLANGGCAGGRAGGRASHAGSRAPFQHSAENRSSKHGVRSTRLHFVPIQKAGWQRIQNCRDTSAFCARIKPKVARNTDLSRHFRILRQRRKPDGRESKSVATLLYSMPGSSRKWHEIQICRDTSAFCARIKPKVARNTDLSRRFWVVCRRQKPGGRKNRTVATDAPEDLWLVIAVGMQVACR